MVLTRECVAEINTRGGTILGSSRGGFDLEKIFEFLKKYNISQLYAPARVGRRRPKRTFPQHNSWVGWGVGGERASTSGLSADTSRPDPYRP